MFAYKSFLLTAAALLLVPSTPVLADTLDFNFANPIESGSVLVTYVPTATAGQFLITGASGTVVDALANTHSITGIIDPGIYPDNPGPASDNLLFLPPVNGGYLDFNGFSFTLDNGSRLNIYYFAPGKVYDIDTNNDGSTAVATFAVASPEPSTLLLTAPGLLGAAGLLRRRRTR